MFDIKFGESGEILLLGRFDAVHEEEVASFLGQIDKSRTVDFQNLEYISSAGLGILLMTHQRLSQSSHALKLINLSNHLRDIFHYAGFDTIFKIE